MLSTKISMVLFLHEWAVINTPGSKIPDFKEPALAGFFMPVAWFCMCRICFNLMSVKIHIRRKS